MPVIKKLARRRKLIKSGIDGIESGYDFEEYVAVVLRRNGYRNIRATPKSGDYGADIIAVKDGDKYAIQCKLYGKPVGVKAIQEVYSAMQYYECQVSIVATNSGFSKNAVNLANSTNTILWDRNTLIEMALKKTTRRDVDEKYEYEPYDDPD
jgi:HJR/Mrr/RecB family endonuclease